MALLEEDIKFLKNLDKNHLHGKNILAKKNKEHIQEFIQEYKDFLSRINEADNIRQKANAFIEYKNFVKEKNKETNGQIIFSAQSKFEPTILEEFLYHLFKEFVIEDIINVGAVKAYNNLYFSPLSFNDFRDNNFIKINEKDQDFSIYKRVKLQDEYDTEYTLSVPVVSIECKTYLDKTMLEGSIATAEKIKSGNPHCKFYIVTETYEVDYKVDPSTSRIDNIFVLKKGGRTKRDSVFYPDVIETIYNEIKSHLESSWSDIENNIINKGSIY